jgi:SAM-dependent methyltransferase
MINVDILCNPYLGEPFKRIENQLIGLASGHKYQIKDDIPVIIDRSYLSRRNRFNNLIYDISAGLYERLLSIGDRFNYSQDISINKDFIQDLSFGPGQIILELGIGTGYSTNYFPTDIEHIGLDISWNMLQQTKRNMQKANREPRLIQALAEYVPIKDNSIDMVFQVGTLQFTEDPFKAVSEMARVAKHGTTIYIMDEISGGMQIFKRSPAHGMHVKSPTDLIKELPRLVPHSMTDIKSQALPGDQFYQLQFTKPQIRIS